MSIFSLGKQCNHSFPLTWAEKEREEGDDGAKSVGDKDKIDKRGSASGRKCRSSGRYRGRPLQDK